MTKLKFYTKPNITIYSILPDAITASSNEKQSIELDNNNKATNDMTPYAKHNNLWDEEWNYEIE